jgi:hypothetical protein
MARLAGLLLGVELQNWFWDMERGKPYHQPMMVKLCNLEKPTGVHQCCENCQKDLPTSELFECGKCKMSVYCSRDCQSSHWKTQHKNLCERLRALRKTPQKTVHKGWDIDSVSLRTFDLQIIGQTLTAKGDYDSALRIYRHARKQVHRLKGKHVSLPLNRCLAFILSELGWFDKASKVMEEEILFYDSMTLPDDGLMSMFAMALTNMQ